MARRTRIQMGEPYSSVMMRTDLPKTAIAMASTVGTRVTIRRMNPRRSCSGVEVVDFLRHVKSDEHKAHHLHSGKQRADQSDGSPTEWMFSVTREKIAEHRVHSRRHEQFGAVEHFIGAVTQKIPAADQAHDEEQHREKCEEHIERDGLRLRDACRPYATKSFHKFAQKLAILVRRDYT